VFSSRLIGLWRPLLGLVAAFALVFVALGSSGRAADAASAPVAPDRGISLSEPQLGPDCFAFQNVYHVPGPFGTFYQPVPIYGNPFSLYQSCINTCVNVPFYLSCVASCTTMLEPLYGFGPLVCPGPPASILFSPAPTDVTCGGASNLEVVVSDYNGLRVVDGTQVNFTTTLGYVSTTDGTQRGLAYTSLTIPTRTSGTALITATAGNATAQKVVYVSC
jgi:hypothetical protein